MYILCALSDKPLIIVWKIDKEQVYMRFACTGLVTTLAADSSSTYCIGSIGDKINIWEISSGHLLAQLSRHYQSVSALHCLPDDNGGYFVSGGRDAIAIVWNLSRVLSEERLSNTKPDGNAPKPLDHDKASIHHIWSSHTMPITDIKSIRDGRYINGTESVKIITCSLDNSCKLFDFTSGTLLVTFLFSHPLTCMALSPTSFWLYGGDHHGNITATPLLFPANMKEISSATDKFTITLPAEHKKPIKSLSLSSYGNVLVSSVDSDIILWDVASTQSIRTLHHKGPIYATIVSSDIWNLTKSHSNIITNNSIITPFNKHLHYSRDVTSDDTVTLTHRPLNMLHYNCVSAIDKWTGQDIINQLTFQPHYTITSSARDNDDHNKQGKDYETENFKLSQELSEIKEVNRKLYSLAMEHLLP
jgi:pre-rRNA-processing protein IPI3